MSSVFFIKLDLDRHVQYIIPYKVYTTNKHGGSDQEMCFGGTNVTRCFYNQGQ